MPYFFCIFTGILCKLVFLFISIYLKCFLFFVFCFVLNRRYSTGFTEQVTYLPNVLYNTEAVTRMALSE